MSRIKGIDAAKAFAIVLVVFGHVLAGATSSGAIPRTVLFDQIYNAIYLFHMPFFFLLSGYVFSGLKRTPGDFARNITIRLAYPYLLWGSLLVAFKLISIAGNVHVNVPVTSFDFIRLAYKPVSPFWFLYALLWIQIVARILLPRIGAKGLLLFSCVTFACSFALEPFGEAIRNTPQFLLFFAAGYAMSEKQVLSRIRSSIMWASLVGFVVLESLCVALSVQYSTPIGRVAGLVLAILLAIAFCNPDTTFLHGQWILFVGQSTLVIYCVHIELTSLTRVICTKIGFGSVFSQLTIGTLVGVCVPLLFYVVLRRLKVAKWFGFPQTI